MKRISLFGAAVALLTAVIAAGSGVALYRFFSTDSSMIGKEEDKLSGYSSRDVNVMLTRPEGWKQIATRSLLTYEDFAGIDGSTATVPITAELARQFCGASDDPNANPGKNYVGSFVNHNKTDVAYDNLIQKSGNEICWFNGETDIVTRRPVGLVIATPPSADENNTAQRLGVTLETEPVALDGFVFITHKDNPVDSLTVQQIKDIYSGRITNWKEVGGRDEKIRPFQRTKNSGSQTAMEELVMQGEPLTDAPKVFVAQGMGELIDRVAEYENETAAIGYTYEYYINNLYKSPDIKVLRVEGVAPGNESFASKEYPFTTAYYAVIRADEPQDSVYRKVRDYLLTDEGQEIIRLAGYCPVKG
ncbi:MAG: substrate-binding domain-containing protein [Ruminococcus sp.]|nr:substrate-binding domain-containing protein [Ruminococcus sp.]